MAKPDNTKKSFFPTREDILAFLKDNEGKITKRDIARAFGIKGPDKVQLKKLLREMSEDGLLAKDGSRALRRADKLPSVQVIEFVGLDSHGEVIARPQNWDSRDADPPKIYISKDQRDKKGRGTGGAMGKGDRALAKLTLIREKPDIYRATILKLLKNVPNSTIGVFHGSPEGGRVTPVSKKDREEFWVDAEDVRGAVDGELVTIEPVRSPRRAIGKKRGRVKERLGDVSSARSISLIAIHTHEIPNEFPEHVLRAAERADAPTLDGRVDLRAVPLITIDPADARDHDDAIWAEKTDDGWHAIVAIADVAAYVRPGSPLDQEARKRGNSCYFPDRVVPMLPEALSAGLCSLKPGEDRAALVVHMWFDKSGNKLKHKFERALINSHANMTYSEAQEAIDGHPNDKTAALLEGVLTPLFATFKALMKARAKRHPLELDLAERKIELSEDGHVAAITLRERFDAHRLVEEFMVSANVCAAEELEARDVPAMYRVHEEPPMDKLESLRDFLATLDLQLAKGTVMRPQLFNGILAKVKDQPVEDLVNQVVLRSQTQAYYSPDNMGHFGLALPRYAHFTSPIRRYSDLIVHRGLVRALKLGDDGLSNQEMLDLAEIGEHISGTERRAMVAERDSTDRYMALYLSEHVGGDFIGRISGVSRHGLFVSLEPSGGDGFIPISQIGADYYILDEDSRALIGEKSRKTYRLGDRVEVRLKEANKYTGGLRLELLDSDNMPAFTRRSPRRKAAAAQKQRPGGRQSRGRRKK